MHGGESGLLYGKKGTEDENARQPFSEHESPDLPVQNPTSNNRWDDVVTRQ